MLTDSILEDKLALNAAKKITNGQKAYMTSLAYLLMNGLIRGTAPITTCSSLRGLKGSLMMLSGTKICVITSKPILFIVPNKVTFIRSGRYDLTLRV